MRAPTASLIVAIMDVAHLRDRMLAGVPATSHLLEAAGIITSVIEVGDGPPLLLLHGGIECGGVMWGPVLAQLGETNRVVVPDVPGLGESAPAHPLDLDTFTSWLRGVISQTGLERPTLIAHSLVGSLAARFATRGDGVIGGLVVYAAPAVGEYRMPRRLRYVGIRFAVRPTPRNAERFERFALFDFDATRQRDMGWFAAFEAYTRTRARVPHVKKTMRGLLNSQTKPIADADLGRIAVPTTLLWGRHDRMVPLAIGEAAAARHGWPLHVIDDAAHAPHIEQPEAFVEALTAIGAAI
jgi:pimeloyl-ACP methyl ester carboxylesterase